MLRSATFQSANGYTVNGHARIVEANGSFALELLDDFQTTGSGGLDVRLCATTSCVASDLDLGPIQGFSGRQSYALANEATPYRFAVIWCRAVGLPFGHGELQ